MPLPSTYDGKILQDELNLSQGEKMLWSNVQSTTDHSIILLCKNIQKLSNSNDKHAFALNILTAGILIVTILQILILLFKR